MSGWFLFPHSFIPFFVFNVNSRFFLQVHFHGSNFDSLHKHLSPNILPTYFKGTLEFDPTTWAETFLNNGQYFEGR